MTDFRIDTNFYKNRKTKAVIRACGFEGAICIQRIWAYAAEKHPDGNLTNFSLDDLEAVAEWNLQEKDELRGVFASLVTSGDCQFFEPMETKGFHIHDWEEHQPWLIDAENRKAAATKAAQAKWRKRNGCATDAEAMRGAYEAHSMGNAESMRMPCEAHSIGNAESMRMPCASDARTQPNLSNLSNTPPIIPHPVDEDGFLSEEVKPRPWREIFEEYQTAIWFSWHATKRTSKKKVRQALESVLRGMGEKRRVDLLEEILAGAKEFMDSEICAEKIQSGYLRELPTWIRQEGYTEDRSSWRVQKLGTEEKKEPDRLEFFERKLIEVLKGKKIDRVKMAAYLQSIGMRETEFEPFFAREKILATLEA